MLSFADVLLPDPQFDPTKQARLKPIRANQVLVSQETFNSTKIENAFDNEGLGQIPIPAQDDKLFLLFLEVIDCHVESNKRNKPQFKHQELRCRHL